MTRPGWAQPAARSARDSTRPTSPGTTSSELGPFSDGSLPPPPPSSLARSSAFRPVSPGPGPVLVVEPQPLAAPPPPAAVVEPSLQAGFWTTDAVNGEPRGPDPANCAPSLATALGFPSAAAAAAVSASTSSGQDEVVAHREATLADLLRVIKGTVPGSAQGGDDATTAHSAGGGRDGAHLPAMVSTATLDDHERTYLLKQLLEEELQQTMDYNWLQDASELLEQHAATTTQAEKTLDANLAEHGIRTPTAYAAACPADAVPAVPALAGTENEHLARLQRVYEQELAAIEGFRQLRSAALPKMLDDHVGTRPVWEVNFQHSSREVNIRCDRMIYRLKQSLHLQLFALLTDRKSVRNNRHQLSQSSRAVLK